MTLTAILLACATTAAAPQQEAKPTKLRAYVGAYAKGPERGIALFEFDQKTGALTPKGLAAASINPSFLAIHPTRKFLYSVNEIDAFDGKKAGGVSAFAIDQETGKLTLLNQQTSGGDGPCHLTVDRTGRTVLVANYGGGSVESIPIDENGRLGNPTSFIQHSGTVADRRRQGGPHAHSINLDAANRFAVAADLGLDKLFVYRFDAEKGTLTPNDPPSASVAPRSGPRHFAFHPDGRHAYVINEISCTVTAFNYDPDRGVLTSIQTVTTLPEPVRSAYSTAEVVVHPSGKFLYGSNRGHDSIAIFAIDQSTGRLTTVGNKPTEGKTPRNFAIDPSGAFLLAENQDSGTIVVFRIDPQTGRLKATSQTAKVPSPVCIKFVRVGD